MDKLGISNPSSFADITEAYRDMAKVWHPDRFENDGRLRQKAEERFKNIQQAFSELKEHREKNGVPYSKPHGTPQGPIRRTAFTLTSEYALRQFAPLIDGKRVIHVSQMSLSEQMVTAEKFKRNYTDIRLMVAGYLFTDSEIVGRGWLSKITVPLTNLPLWKFELSVVRIPDFADRFAAKLAGDTENLQLIGTCRGVSESLMFRMYDQKLEKLLAILNELSRTVANE